MAVSMANLFMQRYSMIYMIHHDSHPNFFSDMLLVSEISRVVLMSWNIIINTFKKQPIII